MQGTSPIESARRYCYVDFEVPIYLSGTLTTHVRVNPGDWILGDMDGVIAISKEIASEVLEQAEFLCRRLHESGCRVISNLPLFWVSEVGRVAIGDIRALQL